MACIINPWTYYIANGEMRNVPMGNSEMGKREIWAIVYFVVVSIVWGVLFMYLYKYLEGKCLEYEMSFECICLSYPFSVGVYVCAIYYGIKKILNVRGYEKKSTTDKSKKRMEIWVARDSVKSSGKDLFLYSQKPKKRDRVWLAENRLALDIKEENLPKGVNPQWTDKEPTKLEMDLLYK